MLTMEESMSNSGSPGQVMLPLRMEEGDRPGKVGCLHKLEKARTWFSAQRPQEGPCGHLDLVSTVRPISGF